MNKRLVIDAEKCDGCGICELVCALNKTGQWHPALSRIRVFADQKRELHLPMICVHCIDPLCITACLMNVIKKDQETGLTIRDESLCIGCRACEISCPFSGCIYDYTREIVVNCDLCQGDPICVKYCPTKALQFVSEAESAAQKRDETAEKRVVELVG
jgi:Fe-S-cluster-containing hydrogenase component 2